MARRSVHCASAMLTLICDGSTYGNGCEKLPSSSTQGYVLKRDLYLKDICYRDCYNEQAYLLHLAASIYVPDSDLLSQNCHTFDSACLFGDLAEGESQDWIWEKAISWNAYLMKRSTCS